jgi:hypothetical protein
MNEEEPLDRAAVREFVIAGHGNPDRVVQMLEQQPALLNASHNWTEGDWETALGGAAHCGRRDIARLLLERGARMDLFAAAMLDEIEVVRAIIVAQPSARTAPGPHGIPLLAHAEAGKAHRVIEYLKSLG